MTKDTSARDHQPELEYTLTFIERVKEGDYTEVSPQFPVVSSREDEVYVYSEDTETITLDSFCN